MQAYLNKQKSKEKKKADRDKALADKQAKKAAQKAVKDAKRELKKAEKAKKKARIEETAELKNDFKEERYLNGNPEHIAEKKEESKTAKQIQKAEGTWGEDEVNYPHKSRFANFNVAIDLSKARSDGKCGKSAEWAPCALVPTLGRRDPTPCCNFDTNHCLRSSECDCPHCVDFAEVNRATQMVKRQIASQNYPNNIEGMLMNNRDLFHLWATQHVFQPKLLEDTLIKINEQSRNVMEILKNAANSKCINEALSLDAPLSSKFHINVHRLQTNDEFHEVLKLILKTFVGTKTEERCTRKMDIWNHKVEKTVETIKKAVMKMQNTLGLTEDKRIDVPKMAAHFAPEQSRKEKRNHETLTRLQVAANEESARLMALSEN